MGIYFGNHFGREPFQFDSVGNHWEQESVARPDGYPRYHYLQTESGCGIVSVKGEDILLEPGQGILLLRLCRTVTGQNRKAGSQSSQRLQARWNRI